MKLIGRLLKTYIRRGQLCVFDPNGRKFCFGSTATGPSVTVRLHDRSIYRKAMVDPELAVAEAYMDGTLTLEGDTTCVDFIELFFLNVIPQGIYPVREKFVRLLDRIERISSRIAVSTTKRQVRHHYDLSTDLYRLFLDDGLNYSCAYYRTPEDTLEDAQAAKLDHILAKLDIKPGMRVLEIGGGWGSLAIRMAQAGADVTSLNISTEQVAIAEERVAAANLQGSVRFLIEDYREFTGQFDRIVSVGMMEHVGPGKLEGYFDKVRECLTTDGFAVIHSIVRMAPPGTTGPFILKYIFPGGYCPALSEVMTAVEKQDLWVCDAEMLRLHYYYTLKAWRERFEARWDEVAGLYDERFCRMWQIYLAGCEISFLHGTNMVTQLILSKKRDAVPIIRDYITDNEREIWDSAPHLKRSA